MVWADLYDIFKSRKIECILFLIGCILSCVIFRYLDGLSLQAWALEMPDALFRGGISGFNEIFSQNLWNAPHGVTNSPFFIGNIIYSIWNLPVLLIHYIFNLECALTLPIRMWGKLFFVFMLLGTGYIAYKIVYQITEKKDRGTIAAILIWGSTTMMISIGYSMQDEIVYMFTLIVALYYLINNRNNFALFWMIMSCLLNPVMIIFCIIIIVSMCEKISEIIIRCGIIIIVTILNLLLSLNLPSGSDDYIGWYFARSLFQVGNSSVSVFALVIALVTFFQFFSKRKDFDEKCRFLFFSLSIVSFGMCTFGWLHFYRFMTCIPFFVISILIIKSEEAVKSGIFSLLLFECFKTIIACTDSNCLMFSYTTNFIADKLPGGAVSLFQVFAVRFPKLVGSISIIGGFAVACGIYILIVSHPTCKKKNFCHIPTKVMTVVWTSIPLLLVIMFTVIGLKTDCFTTDIGGEAPLASAITGEECLEEYYCGKAASYVNVTVRPVTWKRQYPDNQKINLDIIERKSGNIIATVSHGANELPDNDYFTFSLKGVNIKAGQEYIFRFYSPEKIENPDDYIFFLRSNGGTADLDKHYALEKNNIKNYDIISNFFAM